MWWLKTLLGLSDEPEPAKKPEPAILPQPEPPPKPKRELIDTHYPNGFAFEPSTGKMYLGERDTGYTFHSCFKHDLILGATFAVSPIDFPTEQTMRTIAVLVESYTGVTCIVERTSHINAAFRYSAPTYCLVDVRTQAKVDGGVAANAILRSGDKIGAQQIAAFLRQLG